MHLKMTCRSHIRHQTRNRVGREIRQGRRWGRSGFEGISRTGGSASCQPVFVLLARSERHWCSYLRKIEIGVHKIIVTAVGAGSS